MNTHPAFKQQQFVIPVINERPLNQVADYEGFRLSYNASARDYGCDTTAIVLGGRVFLVLNGNHTHALHAAVVTNGVQGCIDYFSNNLSQSNSRSEHLMLTGPPAGHFWPDCNCASCYWTKWISSPNRCGIPNRLIPIA